MSAFFKVLLVNNDFEKISCATAGSFLEQPVIASKQSKIKQAHGESKLFFIIS
jgi:hypothetical protein